MAYPEIHSSLVSVENEQILYQGKWIDSLEFAARWISNLSGLTPVQSKLFHGDLTRFHGGGLYPSPYAYLMAMHYYSKTAFYQSNIRGSPISKEKTLETFLMCSMLAWKYLEDKCSIVAYSSFLSCFCPDLECKSEKERKKYVDARERDILEALDYQCDVKIHVLEQLILDK